MFSLCMVESGADEVNLHGVTSLGLKQALEFAYTGQVWYRASKRPNMLTVANQRRFSLRQETSLFFLLCISMF